jgi:hypothetical protein
MARALTWLLAAAAALVAYAGARAGAGFMYGLEQLAPALEDLPPIVEDPHTPRLARRVILVIVDGLRLDASRQPYLDSLRKRGVALVASSQYPTWSRPNYVSILAGVPPIASGVRTNHHPRSVVLDTIMDRARAAGLRTASVSDRAMLPPFFLKPATELDDLDFAIVDDRLRPPSRASWAFDDARYSRDELARVAGELVGGEAELVVILTGVVDAAGHASGAASDAYRDAAAWADGFLAELLPNVDLARDAIVVTADHGHSDRGGHGGLEPEVVQVPLILLGAGVVAAPVEGASLLDIAPTIAALLGIPAPGHGLGRTLGEVLRLDADARARRDAADGKRIEAARTVVETAQANAATEVASRRVIRLVAVAIAAVLALVGAALAIRRGAARLGRRTPLGAAGAIGGMAIAAALLATHASPSVIPTKSGIVMLLAGFAIASAVLHIAAAWWALRGREHRRADANGIALVALAVAVAPGAFAWALVPPPFTTPPGPVEMVVVPGLELAGACVATGVAAMLAVAGLRRS